MDRRRAAGLLLALAACFATSVAAPTASNHTALDLYGGSPDGCYYNFQHYGEGDRIMTNEPCLNCTCHNRMLMCYLKVCPFTKPIGQDCTIEKRADQCCPIVTCPDVPVDLLTSTTTSPMEYGSTGIGKLDKYGCSINGKYFSEGSKVPPTPNKPCEHCYCIRNMTTCVMQECTLHVDGCTPIYHKDVCCPVRYSCDHPEDEMPLLDDLSTTVRPTPGFLLTTTTLSPVTQMTQDCVYDNQVFPDGALIKTEKACDHCYCMKGDIVCVVQECGTPMENEGKNCTALPPREGVCCPDTYICEGDEPTTGSYETEITQTNVETDHTTLVPPRRTGSEGSGYRIEPDEVTYTEPSIIETDIEGSGEEPLLHSSEGSPQVAPGITEEAFANTEEPHEYIPLTTSSTSNEFSEKSTSIPNQIDESTTTSQMTENVDMQHDKTAPDVVQTTTDYIKDLDDGSGDNILMTPDDFSKSTMSTLMPSDLSEITTTSTPTDHSEKQEEESVELNTNAPNALNEDKENGDAESGSTTTEKEHKEASTDISISPTTQSSDYAMITKSEEIPVDSTPIILEPNSFTTTSASPIVDELTSVEKHDQMTPIDEASKSTPEPQYIPSSTTSNYEEEFITTESQDGDLINQEMKTTIYHETPHHVTNTPMLEEVEKDTTEFTEKEQFPPEISTDFTKTPTTILASISSEISTEKSEFTTTVDGSLREKISSTTDIPKSETEISEVYTERDVIQESLTTTMRPSDHKLDEVEMTTSYEDNETKFGMEPISETTLENVEIITDRPDASITTENIKETINDLTKITTEISSIHDITTEPDKGINTIPSGSIDDDVSTDNFGKITTEADLTETEQPDIENKFNDDLSPIPALPVDTTNEPSTPVSLSGSSTYNTEPTFKKEDETSSDIIVSSEPTTPAIVTKEYLTTISQEPTQRLSTESDKQVPVEIKTTSQAPYSENDQIVSEYTTIASVQHEFTTSETPEVFEKLPETVTTTLPETTIANQEENEIFNEPRIPGEGACLINGVTYVNDSIVPSTNKCLSGCKCTSSIVKCDPIICSPPPEYMDNCQTTYDSPDSCCPTYVCDHKIVTIPPQSHTQMSGTESPSVSDVVCHGDECKINDDKKQVEEQTANCLTGKCDSEVSTSSTDKKSECSGEECKTINNECSNENGCQVSPVTPCEGENCKSIIEPISPHEPQEIKPIDIPKPLDEKCTEEKCEKKESSPLDQTPSTICEGAGCITSDTNLPVTSKPDSDKSSDLDKPLTDIETTVNLEVVTESYQPTVENKYPKLDATTEKLDTTPENIHTVTIEKDDVNIQKEFTTKPEPETSSQSDIDKDFILNQDKDKSVTEGFVDMNDQSTSDIPQSTFDSASTKFDYSTSVPLKETDKMTTELSETLDNQTDKTDTSLNKEETTTEKPAIELEHVSRADDKITTESSNTDVYKDITEMSNKDIQESTTQSAISDISSEVSKLSSEIEDDHYTAVSGQEDDTKLTTSSDTAATEKYTTLKVKDEDLPEAISEPNVTEISEENATEESDSKKEADLNVPSDVESQKVTIPQEEIQYESTSTEPNLQTEIPIASVSKIEEGTEKTMEDDSISNQPTESVNDKITHTEDSKYISEHKETTTEIYKETPLLDTTSSSDGLSQKDHITETSISDQKEMSVTTESLELTTEPSKTHNTEQKDIATETAPETMTTKIPESTINESTVKTDEQPDDNAYDITTISSDTKQSTSHEITTINMSKEQTTESLQISDIEVPEHTESSVIEDNRISSTENDITQTTISTVNQESYSTPETTSKPVVSFGTEAPTSAEKLDDLTENPAAQKETEITTIKLTDEYTDITESPSIDNTEVPQFDQQGSKKPVSMQTEITDDMILPVSSTVPGAPVTEQGITMSNTDNDNEVKSTPTLEITEKTTISDIQTDIPERVTFADTSVSEKTDSEPTTITTKSPQNEDNISITESSEKIPTVSVDFPTESDQLSIDFTVDDKKQTNKPDSNDLVNKPSDLSTEHPGHFAVEKLEPETTEPSSPENVDNKSTSDLSDLSKTTIIETDKSQESVTVSQYTKPIEGEISSESPTTSESVTQDQMLEEKFGITTEAIIPDQHDDKNKIETGAETATPETPYTESIDSLSKIPITEDDDNVTTETVKSTETPSIRVTNQESETSEPKLPEITSEPEINTDTSPNIEVSTKTSSVDESSDQQTERLATSTEYISNEILHATTSIADSQDNERVTESPIPEETAAIGLSETISGASVSNEEVTTISTQITETSSEKQSDEDKHIQTEKDTPVVTEQKQEGTTPSSLDETFMTSVPDIPTRPQQPSEPEQSIPVMISEKPSTPQESLTTPTETSEKVGQDTTQTEQEFILTSTKATTLKSEQEVTTIPALDKTTKVSERPEEQQPSTEAPELPKPVATEAQPTDEVPSIEEDGQFPPSGSSGYGQEPDYVEEDQTFGPGTCRYGGKVYVSAQQIPRDDPCDFCFCFRSDIICLQQSCPPPIHGCHEEPIQGFCCPRYECPVSMATTVNVTTTTTTTTTTLPPHFPTHPYKGSAQRRGCQIKGHTYKVGEVVRASSGPCLHCTCGGDGQMKCDPKACTPEPMLRQMIAAAVSAKRRR